MSTTRRLTESEKENFKRMFTSEGYFIVRDVVSRERLADLHKAMSQEFDTQSKSGALFSGGGLVSGHLNCFPGAGARFAYEALEDYGIIDLIKELDPHVVRLPRVGCNFNLPGSHTQHLHTDRGYSRDFMIANIAVVDTDIENGAMELIPGTHSRLYKYRDRLGTTSSQRRADAGEPRGRVRSQLEFMASRNDQQDVRSAPAALVHVGGRRQQGSRSVRR